MTSRLGILGYIPIHDTRTSPESKGFDFIGVRFVLMDETATGILTSMVAAAPLPAGG